MFISYPFSFIVQILFSDAINAMHYVVSLFSVICQNVIAIFK